MALACCADRCPAEERALEFAVALGAAAIRAGSRGPVEEALRTCAPAAEHIKMLANAVANSRKRVVMACSCSMRCAAGCHGCRVLRATKVLPRPATRKHGKRVTGAATLPTIPWLCYNLRAVQRMKRMDTDRQEIRADSCETQEAEYPISFCPVCSERLEPRRCKLVCGRCGYYLSCSDYY